MEVKVYIHPTCPASVKLMLSLKNEGLISKVKLIDVSRRPYSALEKGVLSVPAVEISGSVVVQGVVHERTIEFIRRGKVETIEYGTVQELVDRLIRGILESFAVTAWTYVNWALTPILENKQFTSSVIGVYGEEYSKVLPGLEERVSAEEEALLRNIEDHMVKSIAFNAVREMYWAHSHPQSGRELTNRIDIMTFAHWLQVRGCIGRVGLNIRPVDGDLQHRVKRAYDYLVENYEEILPRIVREQERVKAMLREYGWEV